MMHCPSISASPPASSRLLLRLSPSPPKAVTRIHEERSPSSPRALACCRCGRRTGLLGASAAALLPVPSSAAPDASSSDPAVVMERVHPPRPDWYEEFYARTMKEGMRSYEAEIADYKEKLFANLTGKSKKILELGVGTAPNFKYYAAIDDLEVIGVDPNKQMEKYSRAAAVATGLPLKSFNFKRGVAEALPLRDSSVDAVVGTLVLCSVNDVGMALREVKRVLKPGGIYLFIEHVAARDGSLLRCVQGALDPLQQFMADGCHLTRETGMQISEVGFSSISQSMAFLSSVSLISPHVYGVACK
ncbi:uncharacterized protein [Typha latifolia]|uniref:uncharacterized protein n=1 Tax=Typha latifolia TaxID=4733 RepID=UPI003C2C9534